MILLLSYFMKLPCNAYLVRETLLKNICQIFGSQRFIIYYQSLHLFKQTKKNKKFALFMKYNYFIKNIILIILVF